MEAFVKIYGRKIAELVQQVYEIEQLRDKCNRKCTIKTIKKEKIKENEKILKSLSKSKDLAKVEQLKAQNDKYLLDIKSIDEFLNQTTPAMIKTREKDLESLLNRKWHTTIESLSRQYLAKYKLALAQDQQSQTCQNTVLLSEFEKAIFSQSIDNPELERQIKDDATIGKTVVNESRTLGIENGENNINCEARDERILSNIIHVDNFEPELSKKEKNDLMRKSFFQKFIHKDVKPITKKSWAKSAACQIPKTDSFEFSQMKDELEYPCSAQLSRIIESNSRNNLNKSSSYHANISNNDGTWMDKFNQECDRENELWRQHNPIQPGTSRPVSSIKITKIPNQPQCIIVDDTDDSSLEELYPSNFERDFLGSQDDINFFKSCLQNDVSKQTKMKPSDSIYEIKKPKKSKQELIIHDTDEEIADIDSMGSTKKQITNFVSDKRQNNLERLNRTGHIQNLNYVQQDAKHTEPLHIGNKREDLNESSKFKLEDVFDDDQINQSKVSKKERQTKGLISTYKNVKHHKEGNCEDTDSN